MLNPKKTFELEALLKRIRELDAEIAQHEQNLREGEARLPIEEQLRLKLRRFIEANIPELAGKLTVKISYDYCPKTSPSAHLQSICNNRTLR